jgi:hypothetical protein
MSKATLIEFWRDLILSDEAMQRYKVNRAEAISCYILTEEERLSLLNEDYASLYRRGVPLELLFQGILLMGLNPVEYLRKLQNGLNYTGPGKIATGAAGSTRSGNWTPSA